MPCAMSSYPAERSCARPYVDIDPASRASETSLCSVSEPCPRSSVVEKRESDNRCSTTVLSPNVPANAHHPRAASAGEGPAERPGRGKYGHLRRAMYAAPALLG